ncbi:MAG: hypothetical protein ABH859_05940 [Pseudomonadota bacterium]
MPTFSEFFTNFGLAEIILTVLTFAVIVGVREASPLGIFRRKKKK